MSHMNEQSRATNGSEGANKKILCEQEKNKKKRGGLVLRENCGYNKIQIGSLVLNGGAGRLNKIGRAN